MEETVGLHNLRRPLRESVFVYDRGGTFAWCPDLSILKVLDQLRITVADEIPVEEIPDSGGMLGSAVLIFQVVGMFPDVDGEQRFSAVGERAILVGGALNEEGAIFFEGEPAPAAAEVTGRGFGQFILELIEAAKVFIDGFGEFALRFGALVIGAEYLPVEIVIGDSAAVVNHSGADFRRDGVQVSEHFAWALAAEAGEAGDGFIEVGHVRRMMFIMVDRDRLRINVGFKSIVSKGQRRQLEWLFGRSAGGTGAA